ncbi:hypothetical protein SAMN04515647_1630 [Cohaesibacter sp. ES.047]|uniref:hypothetical protein n=1 Tax=Cohaesibacter sp. ES.047 TaxID=1798205 RepID=UPI000BB6ABA4|nr:hypothetical protein [Cohaesibacter sp. ES.047]SNY91408.1 hypothetical protein SAMN04515647_1630 [Cohaesibacter sp. ES.047]
MAILVRAHDGELLEELIMRHYGRQSVTLVELVRSHVKNRPLNRPNSPIALDMTIEVWCPDAPLSETPNITPFSQSLDD